MVQNTFKQLRSHPIEHLKLELIEYNHEATQAKHYHIKTDHSENVFLVAFRTNPEDSTGVAHILEHTSLCGSRRYPVRDPFFLMLRRSLNTFMNAFTSSDWTAYPFATQNRKDYYNLLSVYLDAVFFSRLDPLDFAQEGHRLEFAEPQNSQSDLVYKGVVFNEMKGAMSSTGSMLYDLISRYVFPTNTYHFNSGGAPTDIPDLTYEQLIAFYKTHYHPSNAIFFTYGDIPVTEIQAFIEEQALSEFSKDDRQLSVPNEKRYFAPIYVQEAYGLEQEGPLTEKSFLMMSWLLGENANPMDRLEAQLLSDALLDHSASPLRKALESFPHASAPSHLCGLEDSQKEMCFICGVEGSDPEHADTFEQLVLDELNQIAEHGMPLAALEAVCHQIELSQREVGGDHYPYGLQLILTALPATIHRSDPIELLDIDPYLQRLRHQIKDPDYIKTLVKQLLINNPHRVQLTVRPDSQINERKRIAEQARLAAIKTSLSPEEAQHIMQQTQALEDRQNEAVDASVLPKVGLEDINPNLEIPSPTTEVEVNDVPLTYYKTGTNGITYLQCVIPSPDYTTTERAHLPLFDTLLTEVGSGGRDYLETQFLQNAISGGISGSHGIKPPIDNPALTLSFFSLATKYLHRNSDAALGLLHDTLMDTQFNENQRIQDLIAQKRSAKERGLTGSGHSYAMLAAASGLNPLLHHQHSASGLLGIQSLTQLDDTIKQTNSLQNIPQVLTTILDKLAQQPKTLLCVADQSIDAQIQQLHSHQLTRHASTPNTAIELAPPTPIAHQVWTIPSQVNFCAQAFRTVAANHPDSPALTVLASFLRNGFLHRSIREQGGAYGGGASHDSAHGVFKFFSYRDPRIAGTLEDFRQSVQWCLTEAHSKDPLIEAILSIVSGLDKPSSPAGEALQAYYDRLYGRDPEFRLQYRSAVTQVTLQDLQRVAEQYLTQGGHTAIVTSQALWSQVTEDELVNKSDYCVFSI